MRPTYKNQNINNIIKEDETAFYINGEGLRQLNAEDYQEAKQYFSSKNGWKIEKSKNRMALYKADDDVINWLNEHKHFHRVKDVYFLVSDVKQSDIKNKIINFFEADGYVKRRSKFSGESRDKMIWVKRL